MKAAKLFISYAHEDRKLKDELLLFLNPLKRSKHIEIWDDKAIVVGEKWDDKIKAALNECEMILFLLSPYFLASDYINDVEIVKAMQRHKEGRLRLVPIMLSECDLSSHMIEGEEEKISDFEGLPDEMKPIDTWDPRSKGWMSVINGLKRALPFYNQQ